MGRGGEMGRGDGGMNCTSECYGGEKEFGRYSFLLLDRDNWNSIASQGSGNGPFMYNFSALPVQSTQPTLLYNSTLLRDWAMDHSCVTLLPFLIQYNLHNLHSSGTGPYYYNPQGLGHGPFMCNLSPFLIQYNLHNLHSSGTGPWTVLV